MRLQSLPARPAAAGPAGPLNRTTVRRLYVAERLGVRTVAARLGVSPDKVRAELASYRIPIRRPGRPGRLT